MATPQASVMTATNAVTGVDPYSVVTLEWSYNEDIPNEAPFITCSGCPNFGQSIPTRYTPGFYNPCDHIVETMLGDRDPAVSWGDDGVQTFWTCVPIYWGVPGPQDTVGSFGSGAVLALRFQRQNRLNQRIDEPACYSVTMHPKGSLPIEVGVFTEGEHRSAVATLVRNAVESSLEWQGELTCLDVGHSDLAMPAGDYMHLDHLCRWITGACYACHNAPSVPLATATILGIDGLPIATGIVSGEIKYTKDNLDAAMAERHFLQKWVPSPAMVAFLRGETTTLPPPTHAGGRAVDLNGDRFDPYDLT